MKDFEFWAKIGGKKMRKYNLLPWSLTIVRIIVGWHFLYEGVIKIFGIWTSAAYLSGSKWIFSGIFHAIVNNDVLMRMTDLLNMWGLTIIGIALILGIFTRLASFSGALLMLLYYVAYPPFLSYLQGVVTDGSYLWVNRTLIELFVLITLGSVPAGVMYGTDRMIKMWKDNYFDYNPPRTIEFMSSLGQPWIGFKVLAAGSIKPEVGFKYAFENGADFITVGIYDFQVVDDVNLVNSILLEVMNRKRPWCG